MGGDSEYEPRDSRNVTGVNEAQGRHSPDGRWSGDPQKPGHGGEYEPRDSRNVTGQAATRDGRWASTDRDPPRADDSREDLPTPEEVAAREEDEPVEKQGR